MFEFLLAQQLWIKALHLIAAIFWMAGMMYLPRLFVYHSGAIPDGEMEKSLILQERRLLKIIINPAMMLTLVFGLLLILVRHADLFRVSWLWVKLAGIFILFGIHGILSADVKKFARGERPRSEKYYRMINEVPAFLIILIVIMAIVEPF